MATLEDQLTLALYANRDLTGRMVRMITDNAEMLEQALSALNKLRGVPTTKSEHFKLAVAIERVERTLDVYAATVRELKDAAQ